MIITRKIEVYVSDEDKERQKELRHTIYVWRDEVRKVANMIVAHKFAMQEIRNFMCLQPEVRERFLKVDDKGREKMAYHVSDMLIKEPGNSEQNVTYRMAASLLKGKVPADIYSCLNQTVANTFKETIGDYLSGKASVRSYKNNISIPFSSKAIANIHKADDGRFYFTLFGIPFACRLGRDRSNNEAVIDRCIGGEYKICSSSLMIDDARKKIYLLFCVDMPKKDVELDKGKTLTAYLDVDVPIRFFVDIKAKQAYDSGKHTFAIGSKEEFLHRRLQIQDAVRRCQIANRYTNGGRGRKKKCQAIERWHEKEKHYVETKLHTYSKLLVQEAVRNRCGTIVLLNQKAREDAAKTNSSNGEPFILRNWSYYGMKEKISYKAAMYGIRLIEDEAIIE
ncbi:MAG: hypothetical protein IJ557_02615 [Bacteroidaceae bacterium]|nr:hypothetical protein [Bacteroidaceae bacterium]